jgi:hypothetical protein
LCSGEPDFQACYAELQQADGGVPVCGCDGRQYPNSCYAEQAHVGWYDADGGCP